MPLRAEEATDFAGIRARDGAFLPGIVTRVAATGRPIGSAVLLGLIVSEPSSICVELQFFRLDRAWVKSGRPVMIDIVLANHRLDFGCTAAREVNDFGLRQLRAGSSVIDLIDVTGFLGQMGGAAPGAEARNMDHFAPAIEPFDLDTLHAHFDSIGVEYVDPPVELFGAEGIGPRDLHQGSRRQHCGVERPTQRRPDRPVPRRAGSSRRRPHIGRGMTMGGQSAVAL